MARLAAQFMGRLSSTLHTVDQGPAGEFAWQRSGGSFTNGQLHHNYTAAADVTDPLSYVGTFSAWFYIETGATLAVGWTLTASRDVVLGQTSNGIDADRTVAPQIFLRNGLAGTSVEILNVTGTVVPSVDTWHHLLISWNVAAGATYATEFHMYLDDVAIKPATPARFDVGQQVKWGNQNTNFATSMRFGNDSAQAYRLAVVYLNHRQYLDLSVESVRRRFISAALAPVPLGVSGDLPTGIAPYWYFDNPVATLTNNRGSGEDFSLGTTLIDVGGPGA